MATRSVAVARAAPTFRERTQWGMAFERFRAHRPAVVGIAVLSALALLCAAAPLVSPYDPEKTALLLIYEPPSPAHPFGTDGIGRDLATRILYGGRVSLSIGLLAVAVAVSLGTLVGVIAGFYGRWVDSVLMRFVDMMYSFPRLFLLILFGVIFKGMTLPVIVTVLGLLSWNASSSKPRGASAPPTAASSSGTSSRTRSRRSSSPRPSASPPRSSPRAPCPSSASASSHRHRAGATC